MLTKQEFLQPLARQRKDEIVVATMGLVRPWGKLSQHELDFASADSAMGHAADLALGLALAQPQRRVICLNGDGSMLMSLGTLITIVQARATNLLLFIAQNDTYEITSNQLIPGAGKIDFAVMARACGFAYTFHFEEAREYEQQLAAIWQLSGPILIAAHLVAGAEKPLARRATEEYAYLQPSLAESAHRLREALTRRS